MNNQLSLKQSKNNIIRILVSDETEKAVRDWFNNSQYYVSIININLFKPTTQGLSEMASMLNFTQPKDLKNINKILKNYINGE